MVEFLTGLWTGGGNKIIEQKKSSKGAADKQGAAAKLWKSGDGRNK